MTSRRQIEPDEPAFAGAKRLFVYSALAIASGLAIAGTLDRAAGGVVLLAGWAGGILALHRLGRSGSKAPKTKSPKKSEG